MERMLEARGSIFPDVAVSVTSDHVSPEQVYGALADLHRHLAWGGAEERGERYGLTSMQAAHGPAEVGSEFRSTGVDPMGTFSDRSIVTEATRPALFEFVTEGRLTPARAGQPASDTTFTHRYEIEELGNGCRVTYRVHTARWTNPPSMLTSRLLRPIVRVVAARSMRSTLRALLSTADQR